MKKRSPQDGGKINLVEAKDGGRTRPAKAKDTGRTRPAKANDGAEHVRPKGTTREGERIKAEDRGGTRPAKAKDRAGTRPAKAKDRGRTRPAKGHDTGRRKNQSGVFSDLVSGRLARLVRSLLHREAVEEGAGNKHRDHDNGARRPTRATQPVLKMPMTGMGL